MSSGSGSRLGKDANPHCDGTEDRFLSFDRFFILVLFFVLRRFSEIDGLETDDVYRRKANLEIPVSKLYDAMDIN